MPNALAVGGKLVDAHATHPPAAVGCSASQPSPLNDTPPAPTRALNSTSPAPAPTVAVSRHRTHGCASATGDGRIRPSLELIDVDDVHLHRVVTCAHAMPDCALQLDGVLSDASIAGNAPQRRHSRVHVHVVSPALLGCDRSRAAAPRCPPRPAAAAFRANPGATAIATVAPSRSVANSSSPGFANIAARDEDTREGELCGDVTLRTDAGQASGFHTLTGCSVDARKRAYHRDKESGRRKCPIAVAEHRLARKTQQLCEERRR